jgi:hypothetical protein
VLWRPMPALRKPADMRTLFGWLAALLCVVSVVLAARYGYKGADTEVDGLISGIVFGLIALCACREMPSLRRSTSGLLSARMATPSSVAQTAARRRS